MVFKKVFMFISTYRKRRRMLNTQLWNQIEDREQGPKLNDDELITRNWELTRYLSKNV